MSVLRKCDLTQIIKSMKSNIANYVCGLFMLGAVTPNPAASCNSAMTFLSFDLRHWRAAEQRCSAALPYENELKSYR